MHLRQARLSYMRISRRKRKSSWWCSVMHCHPNSLRMRKEGQERAAANETVSGVAGWLSNTKKVNHHTEDFPTNHTRYLRSLRCTAPAQGCELVPEDLFVDVFCFRHQWVVMKGNIQLGAILQPRQPARDETGENTIHPPSRGYGLGRSSPNATSH